MATVYCCIRTRLGCGLVLALFLLSSAALAQGPAASAEIEHSVTTVSAVSAKSSGDPSLPHLGPGDLLDVSVYNVPELTSKVRVDSNGEINLPLVNNVQVAGLTGEQAESIIEKRLADGGFVKNPHVTVFVNQAVSQTVSVLGEVARPGVYPIVGEQRLFDLISNAGGLTDRAGPGVTVTHRNRPDTKVTISRNFADHPQSNLPVSAGDTIIVEKADVVYVVGDVGRPSGLLMESGRLTVLQAIAMAGGTTRTAKLSAARIIHRGADGLTETPVQLKKIFEAKAPDVPMQANDILFVPTSAAKSFAGHTVQTALQAAAAASIITVMP
ncbi:MAG: polysaccharide biosynthesis/export family protein [Acidobacteriaceae bacterium]|nr:polysaccharide biosynthesis/export family protein [Acidobacteriaceae bacterium]